MTFISYSQNFEDILLWRALKDVTSGHYVDVGAQDPVVDSVSLAFYEAGWRGMHVEPTPGYAAKLRAARPDETVVEAAISDAHGPIEFFEIEDTGISTGRSDIAEHHAKAGFEPRKILVPTVGLDSLLAAFKGDLHWMKVDVEGMEANVLRSWGESRVRPWLLVIESTFPKSQTATHDQWIEEVLRRDYREVFYDGLSRFFVHRSQRHREAAFAVPANVFDGFAVAQHHFSASLMRDQLEDATVRFRNEIAQADALREAAQASATAAAQRELQVRSELAAATIKEAAIITGMLEAEREHVATIDRLWRERQTAEAQHLSEFKALTEQLQNALDDVRRSESTARAELGRAEEESNALKRELKWVNERLSQSDKEVVEFRLAREGFAAQIEHYRAFASRADHLIRAAIADYPGIVQSLGELLGVTRRPPSWLALATWARVVPKESFSSPSKPAVLVAAEQLDSIMDNGGNTDLGNPCVRANSLNELLKWHDIDFVRCAYVTVLGRPPDPQGEAYYTDRIRCGRSKMEVLWQMRRSSEGSVHDPGIPGFDRALRRAYFERSRLGWLIRPFTGGERDTNICRRLRSLTNALETERNLAAERAAFMRVFSKEIEHKLGAIEQRLNKTLASHVASAGRIAEVEGPCDGTWADTLRQTLDA